MICANCDNTFTVGYIEDIQAKISQKVAKVLNKENSYRKYDFDYVFDVSDARKLITYNTILEKIKKCDSCYEDENIEKIVSRVKVILNQL